MAPPSASLVSRSRGPFRVPADDPRTGTADGGCSLAGLGCKNARQAMGEDLYPALGILVRRAMCARNSGWTSTRGSRPPPRSSEWWSSGPRPHSPSAEMAFELPVLCNRHRRHPSGECSNGCVHPGPQECVILEMSDLRPSGCRLGRQLGRDARKSMRSQAGCGADCAGDGERRAGQTGRLTQTHRPTQPIKIN